MKISQKSDLLKHIQTCHKNVSQTLHRELQHPQNKYHQQMQMNKEQQRFQTNKPREMLPTLAPVFRIKTEDPENTNNSKIFRADHQGSLKYSMTNCEECGKLIQVQNLTRHLNEVHMRRGRYECDICRAKFFDKRKYVAHNEQYHSNDPKSAPQRKPNFDDFIRQTNHVHLYYRCKK